MTECPICLGTVDGGDTHQLTECSHTFHTKCIVQWFRSGNSSCPLCRGSPSMNVGYETIAVRASRLLRRSRAKSACRELKRKADVYRKARDSAEASRKAWATFRKEQKDVIAEMRRLRTAAWRTRWAARRAREDLGCHDLAGEGLRMTRRRFAA